MRKKDVARMALLDVLVRRKAQLAPRVTISASAGMVAEMLPSLIQTLLQVNGAEIVGANLHLVGDMLTMEVKVSRPSGK